MRIDKNHQFMIDQLDEILSKSGSIWIEGIKNQKGSEVLMSKLMAMELPTCFEMIEDEQGPQDFSFTLYQISKAIAQIDISIAYNVLSQLILNYFFSENEVNKSLGFVCRDGFLSSGTRSGERIHLIELCSGSEQVNFGTNVNDDCETYPVMKSSGLFLSTNKDLELQSFDSRKVGKLRKYIKSILFGILSGISYDILVEAFKYSKVRTSAGKAIVHHQAIALRLGNIAIDYESLDSLMKSVLQNSDSQIDTSALLETLSLYSHNICKEAVQVAGGHGYVDGLPLKRLYESSKGYIAFLLMVYPGENNAAS